MKSEHYDQREAMHAVNSRRSMSSNATRCSAATDWTDNASPSWLASIGFNVKAVGEQGILATIIISDYGKSAGESHVDLHLVNHGEDEWVTDVLSYNEDGSREAGVGLVNSWCKTKQDVLKLCDALGITLST